jgi:hypothetical protein
MRVAKTIELDAQTERELRALSLRKRIEVRPSRVCTRLNTNWRSVQHKRWGSIRSPRACTAVRLEHVSWPDRGRLS